MCLLYVLSEQFFLNICFLLFLIRHKNNGEDIISYKYNMLTM